MAVTSGTPRTRRTAEERRRQLIGIGLQMLASRPIHQITIDEVAASAGISRSLLFHYFPTKQDYYVAVVRAASRRLLRRIAPDHHGSPAPAQIRAIVDDYVAYIERRREPYIALFRSPSADDWVRSIHEDTQDALARRVIDALGRGTQPPAVELVVRAWWAFAEELTVAWTGTRPSNRDTLVALLVRTLHEVIDAAGANG